MNSQVTPPPAKDFKRAVALQFASRPTLRKLVGQKVLQFFVERHPNLATVHPPLNDAELLHLMVPTAQYTFTPVSLMDRVMQAVLDGKPLSLEKIHDQLYGLSFPEPYRFKGSDGFEYIELPDTTQAFNDLLQELPFHFQQAQVEYWQGNSSSGVSRDRWLQQTLKAALLQNLPLHDLDAQQRACVYGLLKGGRERPTVFVVEVQLEAEGQSHSRLLPNLLLHGEWDERTVVLWCSPSSVVKCFDSFDDFAQALCEEMGSQYRFDSMRWNRYELEGDAFAQQTALLLNGMLEAMQQLRLSQVADVQAMEQLYAALTDPSQWFIEGYTHVSTAKIILPPGLRSASAADSFAYQRALFELALAQAEFNDAEMPEEILDLHSYASQRLRAQLLAEHPVDANYFPDDLILTFWYAEANPGGAGAGVGGGMLETKRMTLTEFAIGNLSSLKGAVLHSIEHRTGQLIMEWMNHDYVMKLIEQVDIGANYPRYVADKLDDPLTREQRVSNFSREWRCSLMFSALSAKLAGTLSDAGLQCAVDYCHGNIDPQVPAIMMMPLAFKREPSDSQSDLVSVMYVFYSVQPALVLLYRPLYSSSTLMEFASLEALMEAIAEAGPLQDSVLEWLQPEARPVYEYGGFHEPHLGRPIIDSSIQPEPVKPISLATQFWRLDVDAKLYKANRNFLVELADRQSVSNAESRWAVVVQGAWLLFNVTTLVLSGPVAGVVWLVQAIQGLKGDNAALEHGSQSDKIAAVIDIVMNFAMALFHLSLPRVEPPVVSRLPGAALFNGAAPQSPGFEISNLVPEQGKLGLAGSLATRQDLPLDFSWRNGHGLNSLPEQQRQALSGMRSGVSLNGLQALTSGEARGLYEVDGHHYAKLASDIYRVELSAQGIRVIGAEGEQGPWLRREDGQWHIDAGLRLLGGGPKRRSDQAREANIKAFAELNAQNVTMIGERNRIADGFELSKSVRISRVKHVENLKAQRGKVPDTAAGASLILAFDRKIAAAQADLTAAEYQVLEDCKELIKITLKLDRGLTEMVQLKYARHELFSFAKIQRSSLRQELIEDCVALYNDEAYHINSLGVNPLLDEMVARPITDQEIRHYDFVNSLVEKVVALRSDIVWVSKQLDWLLVDTIKDNDIVFTPKPGQPKRSKSAQLTDYIAQRRLTHNDLQLGLLEDLAELCINRKAEVDEEVLLQYHKKLWSAELDSSGTAHGQLAALELPVADRISVLTSTLKVYEAFQGNAMYLSETGGAAIRVEPLKQYQDTLNTLIASAEDDLAQAIRESEFSDPVVPKPHVYSRRTGKHRVVKTSKGRSVIAEEVEVDGVSVVQQKDSSGKKVLKTFNEEGVEQVEEPAVEVQPAPDSRDVGAARASARAALGQVESILKLAKQYIGNNEPIGMQSVIEGHVEQLKEASTALESAGIASEFDTQLSDAIKRLGDTQTDLLSSYHLTTSHPTAASLRFLFKENKIAIKHTVSRKELAANDYLDVYEIRRVPSRHNEQGRVIWEAHFHYKDAMVPARQFVKGHLKIWSQRLIGRKIQMEAARGSSRELLAVYRGNLALADVEGIIPFT